jgi:8-amino-7-oxononanoate synthase
MNHWDFAARLDALKSDARLRVRRTVASPQDAHLAIDGRDLLSFAGNDYLGLAGDARIVAAAQEGAARYGVGSGASHLLSGHFESHAALEEKLAAFVGMERALSFSTGYLANLAILTALADRDAHIFADKLNHACLNDGARLSRAEFKRYNHLDLVQLASFTWRRWASPPALPAPSWPGAPTSSNGFCRRHAATSSPLPRRRCSHTPRSLPSI